MRDPRIPSQIHTPAHTPPPPAWPSDVDRLTVLTADELAAATVIWDPTVDVDLLTRQLAEVDHA